ncbi:MAG: hypothetical protein RH859_05845 [Longimicrobiales bacterium]
MIRALLLVSALAAAVPSAGAHAQTTGTVRTVQAVLDAASDSMVSADTAQTASTPVRRDLPGAPTGVTPAGYVADRVRGILDNPSDPARWQELAGALPELAMAGDGDWEATLDAARLADSVSVAALAAAGTTPPSERGIATPAPASADWPIQPSDLLTLLAGLVALGVVVFSMRSGAVRPRPAPMRMATATPSRAPARAADLPPASMAQQIVAMAECGMTRSEIARRTGLAQDAVSVVVGLNR